MTVYATAALYLPLSIRDGCGFREYAIPDKVLIKNQFGVWISQWSPGVNQFEESVVGGGLLLVGELLIGR